MTRFEILSLAGSGGMGRVHRARDRETNEIVALKILRAEIEQEMRTRFQREIDALARLDHPAIVRHLAHGTTDEGAPYLAMQWIEGIELRKRLKRDGGMDPKDVVKLGARIADALAHAHARGIVHRDVKPSNILLPNDEIERAMLIDFGLAYLGTTDLTQTGMLLGTPTFMSPEQIRGETVTPKVDVFALGCVFYQCLAQVAPFAADGATAVFARVLFGEPVPLSRVLPDVPSELADLVHAMLRKSPSERPSIAEVRRSLGDIDHARETRPMPARLSALEQRIVAVIVAGTTARGDEEITIRHHTDDTVDPSPLGAIADRYDAELMRLPNGTFIGILQTQTLATDLATRAASCALEMERVLHPLPIGLVIGRAQTEEGIPIGEAIDRAVGLAPSKEGVRIDDVTASLLDASFLREGDVLRGRASSIEPVRTLLGKPTPFVGRDAEIAMLEGILAQSESESVARVVLVTAPAGAGKTRIRQELMRRHKNPVWIARADSVAARAPFGMLGQIVRAEARITDTDPIEIARQKLLDRTRDTRIATFLGEMIGVRFSDDDVQLRAARSDPRLMGDQVQRAFVDFLENECATRPMVIALEDLQWGDQPTVTAIDVALRVLEDRPLAVVAFARPEASVLFPDLWQTRSVLPLPLAPLPKKAAVRLVQAVLPSEADPNRIVEQAGGNVFLLEEIVRARVEGRRAAATVVAMVQSRLGALEPEARRVLRAASILGDTFTIEGVRALLGDDARNAQTHLDDLVAREILSASPNELSFRHALLREGAYAMLTDADRILGHRLAAEWIERTGTASMLVVASHFEHANERERAAVAFLRAAEQALESSDLAGAIDHAERGIVMGATGELLGGLRNVQAHAYHWRGDTEEMETAAEDAVTLLRRGDARWVDAVTLLAVAKQRLGRTGDLASVAQSLARMLGDEDGDRSALARAGGRVAALLFFSGRQDDAATMLDAAERVAPRGGADVEARIHQARAPQARQAGKPEAALHHAQAAAHAFFVAGDLRNACMLKGICGFALSELGAYREAEIVLEEARATAVRLGLATVAAPARSNLALVFLRLGRHADAEREARAAIDAFASSDRRHEGGSRAYLAMILRDMNRLDEAEKEARHAVKLLESALALQPLAWAVLATIQLLSQRARDALESSRTGRSWSETGGNVEEGDPLLRLTYARALFECGEAKLARDAIADARDRLLARARTITNAQYHQSFLAIPEHAKTLALASAWLPVA